MVIPMLDEKNKSYQYFVGMVDELVAYADSSGDIDLQEGIKWLDGKAFEKGISFYEMVFRTLYQNDMSVRAKSWLAKKQSQENVNQ